MAGNDQTEAAEDSPPIWKRPVPVTIAVIVLFAAFGQFTAEQDEALGPNTADTSNLVSASGDDVEPIPVVQRIELSRVGDKKRSVEVHLTEAVDEATLERIARQIKTEAPNVERTFIVYLLPGMESGSGAWATTHFDPGLTVQILGLPEERLAALAADEPEGLVGRWHGPMSQFIVSIYRNGGSVFMTRTFSAGEGQPIELREKGVRNAINFFHLDEDYGDGDFYTLHRNGTLEFRDNSGLIGKAPAIAGQFEEQAIVSQSGVSPAAAFAEREATRYESKLRDGLAAIAAYEPTEHTGSQINLGLSLAQFSHWAKLYESGRGLTLDSEQQKLRESFKQKAIANQRRAFPILRDAYGPILRKDLWEFDASARTIGNRYTIVEFVSAQFSANRNIAQVHRTVRDTLMQMRFKQARYKWYTGADSYQYYELDSPGDTALAVWSNEEFRLVD